ncbi:hypothetical protein L9F63_001644, partial [Diploptera punctata]
MDIYSISRLIHIFSKLFGLICYVSVHGKTYTISKFWLTYGVLWGILRISCLPVFVLMQIQNHRRGFHYDTMIIILSYFISVVMIIQITCLINNTIIITIYKRIQQYDSILSDYPRKSYSFNVALFEIGFDMLFPIVTGYAFIENVMEMFKKSGIFLIVYSCFMYLNAYVTLCCAYSQFLVFVVMLHQRFEHLNKILLLITEESSHSRNSLNKIASFNSTHVLQSQRKCKLASEMHIKSIGKLHNMLCEILQYANTTFSVIVILIMALSFFEITWAAYDLLMRAIVCFRDDLTMDFSG